MNVLYPIKLHRLVCVIALIAIPSCKHDAKMLANTDFELSNSAELFSPHVNAEQCGKRLSENLSLLPFSFVDIGEATFQSDMPNWRAYIQCESGKVVVTVQPKQTINSEYDKLDQTGIIEKLELIHQSLLEIYAQSPG